MTKAIPISEVCEVQQLANDERVQISTGHVVFAMAGDWLVRTPVGGFNVVSDHLFRRTYQILPDDCACAGSCEGHKTRPAAWEAPETLKP